MSVDQKYQPQWRTGRPQRHSCSRCGAGLYEADRGYGSTALACPTHRFDRMIVSERT